MTLSRHQKLNLISTALVSMALAFPLKALSTPSETLPLAASTTTSVNFWEAIFLGLVQGLTEFLPISSTAHLKVVPVVLGWGDPGVAFTAVIQLGSIIAVIWYFWADLAQLVTGSLRALKEKDHQNRDWQLTLGICFGTLPIVIFGLGIKAFFPGYETSAIRSLAAIAIASIVMALLLGIAEKIGQRKRDFAQLTLKDGLLMGLAQSLALIPGVSRSGSTITSGLFMGLERATAARFSFLLGIPAITLAGIVEFIDVLGDINADTLIALLVGTISSSIFSYLAIAWLIRFLQTQNTWIFVWYRLGFGIIILLAIGSGWLPNL